MIASAVLVLGCVAEDPEDLCADTPLPPPSLSDLEGGILRCDVAADLCDLPVASIIREADRSVAFDIAFVGDGYSEETIAEYRDRVVELVDELSADSDGIVGRDPGLFNFHRVDVVSDGWDAASRAFGTCVVRDDLTGSLFLAYDTFRVERAAANVPDADLVVVLVADTTEGRGAASQGLSGIRIVPMNAETSHIVLTHEMGHALIGLHDEYVEFDGRHYMADTYEQWTGNVLAPNVSLSADETWDGLVEGAREGADRYAQGVFRPTDHCRMRDAHAADARFCPVCSAAIDAVLAGRRGVPDGPPQCAMAVGAVGDSGTRDAVVFARDVNGVQGLELTVDNAEPLLLDARTVNPREHDARVSFAVSTSLPVASAYRLACLDDMGGRTEIALTPTP